MAHVLTQDNDDEQRVKPLPVCEVDKLIHVQYYFTMNISCFSLVSPQSPRFLPLLSYFPLLVLAATRVACPLSD